MSVLVILLDLVTLAAAGLSGWLWYVASRHRVRRVSRREVLDAADINRLVVAVNRTQTLNARAALVTSVAVGLAAASLLVEFATV
jgi:hypothetical protein